MPRSHIPSPAERESLLSLPDDELTLTRINSLLKLPAPLKR